MLLIACKIKVCLHTVCVHCVYLCINTHSLMYIFKKKFIYMFILVYIRCINRI